MVSATTPLLLLLALPLLSLAQSVVYSTDPAGNLFTSTAHDTSSTTTSSTLPSSTIYTSYTTASTYDGSTNNTYPVSTSVPAVQTVPFTGQALLVGTYVNKSHTSKQPY